MRPLTEEESKTLFAKLANYTGTSLKNLILDNGAEKDRSVFRLHQNRCVSRAEIIHIDFD